MKVSDAGWSNGKTLGSGPSNLGSIPSPAAKIKGKKRKF